MRATEGGPIPFYERYGLVRTRPDRVRRRGSPAARSSSASSVGRSRRPFRRRYASPPWHSRSASSGSPTRARRRSSTRSRRPARRSPRTHRRRTSRTSAWRRSPTTGSTRLAALVGAQKVTPAAVRVQDVPGTGPALLGGLRQVDALLAVADGFSGAADPGERPRDSSSSSCSSPTRITSRSGSSGSRSRRSRAMPRVRKEAEILREVLAHLEAGKPLTEWTGELPAELDPLTTKPLIAIVNGPDGIDCKLEAELAELSDEEAAAFREGAIRARRGRAAAQGRARPDHVLHGGREGDARLDAARRARRRSRPAARSTPTSRAGSSAAR